MHMGSGGLGRMLPHQYFVQIRAVLDGRVFIFQPSDLRFNGKAT
jgi:hypothetical protein